MSYKRVALHPATLRMLAGEATQGHRTVTDCRVGKREEMAKKLFEEIYSLDKYCRHLLQEK